MIHQLRFLLPTLTGLLLQTGCNQSVQRISLISPSKQPDARNPDGAANLFAALHTEGAHRSPANARSACVNADTLGFDDAACP